MMAIYARSGQTSHRFVEKCSIAKGKHDTLRVIDTVVFYMYGHTCTPRTSSIVQRTSPRRMKRWMYEVKNYTRCSVLKAVHPLLTW